MKKIQLASHTPRNASEIKRKFSLHKGLWGMYFFGYFALFGLIIFLTAILFLDPNKDIGLKLFQIIGSSLLIGGASFYLLNKAKRIYASRLSTLIHGSLIHGVVTQHGRAFNPLRSRKNFTLDLAMRTQEAQGKIITIEHTSAALHEYSVGQTMYGLYDKQQQTHYFPVVDGYEIELINTSTTHFRN